MQSGNVPLNMNHTEVYFYRLHRNFRHGSHLAVFRSGSGQWGMVGDSELSFIYMQHKDQVHYVLLTSK